MVVDTLVFAYALFKADGKYAEAMQVLEKAERIAVPDLLQVELANIAWQWVKYRYVAEPTACAALKDADELIDQVVRTQDIWPRALQLAVESNRPAYDTLFVAAAEACDDKVVTYDEALQFKFPNQVIAPELFLGSPT